MVPRSRSLATLALLSVVFLGFGSRPAAEAGQDDWTVASRSANLTVYERVHKGASLKEFKAVGTIDAAPGTVKQVLDDVEEYPRFMPYVIESRVLSREPNSRVSYQRISPPIVGDRDYTIRVRYETRPSETGGGACYCNRWEAANELGPAVKAGVARVKITEGYWLLEPVGDGHVTQATYCIYSDSGGTLPVFVLNGASKSAIPKLFEAIRKQVKLEKYSPK